jgi:hypothetical protein
MGEFPVVGGLLCIGVSGDTLAVYDVPDGYRLLAVLEMVPA